MRQGRLDADESVFFSRQLEHVKSRTYDKKYTEFKNRQIVPVSFEAGPGAETITYEQWDMVGIARVVADYANDFSTADVKAKEFTSRVKSLGSSYKYSVQDIRAAQHAGKPLTQRKADAAKRAIMQLENKITYFGDSEHGINGLFTNANVPNVALPADGAGAATTFASKIDTPDKVVRDLNSIANTVVSQSNGVEVPSSLLLPVDQYTLIASTARSNDSDTTILKYFLDNNPFVREADWLVELAAAQGELAADTAWCYRRDPDALTLEIPQDFEQFPEQEKGLAWEVPVHERIGGVLIYYPLSMTKSDDI